MLLSIMLKNLSKRRPSILFALGGTVQSQKDPDDTVSPREFCFKIPDNTEIIQPRDNSQHGLDEIKTIISAVLKSKRDQLYITHGTDTLETTLRALEHLHRQQKPNTTIILIR